MKLREEVKEDPLIGYLIVQERGLKIPILPRKILRKYLGKYGVDVVIESTGKFVTEEDAKKHAIGGQKGSNSAPYQRGM